MFQRSGARIVLVAVLVAALTLITIDFRGAEDGPLDRVRGTATAVLRPVQDGVLWLVSPIGDTIGNARELLSIRSENARLRERVAALEERRRTRVDLERELAALHDLLEIRERTELDTVTARTVALSPSNFEWTITIDVGSDDGVGRDMPVIDGDGLVGRVIQVTPSSSRVLLAIDPNFSAAARTARSGEIGTLDGRGGDPMLLRLLDPEADVDVGDEIVTSSYQGGAFPAGIPIGTVAEVGETGGQLSREAQVNPFVDFTRLEHVLVVRTSRTESIPPFEGTGDMEFTPPSPSAPPDVDDRGDPEADAADDAADDDADADYDADAAGGGTPSTAGGGSAT